MSKRLRGRWQPDPNMRVDQGSLTAKKDGAASWNTVRKIQISSTTTYD